jgi:hypothetical protein
MSTFVSSMVEEIAIATSTLGTLPNPAFIIALLIYIRPETLFIFFFCC